MSVIAGLATIAASSSWANPQPTIPIQMAQYTAAPTPTVTETGCRQTNATTGIYSQPSLDSSSRGLLNPGQIVRLELIGTGTGWARITEPIIGWVEAKYLTPVSACASTGQVGTSTAPTSITIQAASPHQPAVTKTVTALCEVLPSEGLVVRSQPSTTEGAPLYTLPKGSYQFQFTNNHVTTRSGNLERYWTYIMAPYPGWISLGITGSPFNLGGRECG